MTLACGKIMSRNWCTSIVLPPPHSHTRTHMHTYTDFYEVPHADPSSWVWGFLFLSMQSTDRAHWDLCCPYISVSAAFKSQLGMEWPFCLQLLMNGIRHGQCCVVTDCPAWCPGVCSVDSSITVAVLCLWVRCFHISCELRSTKLVAQEHLE